MGPQSSCLAAQPLQWEGSHVPQAPYNSAAIVGAPPKRATHQPQTSQALPQSPLLTATGPWARP